MTRPAWKRLLHCVITRYTPHKRGPSTKPVSRARHQSAWTETAAKKITHVPPHCPSDSYPVRRVRGSKSPPADPVPLPHHLALLLQSMISSSSDKAENAAARNSAALTPQTREQKIRFPTHLCRTPQALASRPPLPSPVYNS